MTLIVSGRQYKLALLGSRPLNATVNSRDRDHPAPGHELHQEPIIYPDIRQDRAQGTASQSGRTFFKTLPNIFIGDKNASLRS